MGHVATLRSGNVYAPVMDGVRNPLPMPMPTSACAAPHNRGRTGGFAALEALCRRVAALMLQFPPCSVAGEQLTGARAGERSRLAGGLEVASLRRLSGAWAGSRLLGSVPGTRAGAARSKQFRMQFDYLNIQQSPQPLQFQRCDFKAHPNLGGIACEIRGAHQAESHAAPLAAMLTLTAMLTLAT